MAGILLSEDADFVLVPLFSDALISFSSHARTPQTYSRHVEG
ncbi:MAG: hypothetical protein AVDCRST_MAG14-2550 [uncultured Rubrobacteraceae bacterium]|uniref:Uncharacterized protein n=1 Tax=uncultured Rubrobacteraceae bacterium TaxID=349277 RepID=A0A6J4R1U4_9ACTN|nr:MAG: hypothetical protein AVDCRST_MAG14-2550 [uncultured Rubrobacteraceae bacterium]